MRENYKLPANIHPISVERDYDKDYYLWDETTKILYVCEYDEYISTGKQYDTIQLAITSIMEHYPQEEYTWDWYDTSLDITIKDDEYGNEYEVDCVSILWDLEFFEQHDYMIPQINSLLDKLGYDNIISLEQDSTTKLYYDNFVSKGGTEISDIKSIEDFEYVLNCFLALTTSWIGGYCPPKSRQHVWDIFVKVIEMYTTKKDAPKLSHIFFDSIDEIDSYS